jgi:ceramide glucosyltransferase
MTALAAIATVLTGIGLLQALAGWALVVRFAARMTQRATDHPPVSVLKPLYGDEPQLEDALATICEQDYPAWQVVFGVQSRSDPAIAVVHRLQARFPACDIALVINPAQHGENRKVGNLINMLPVAAHPVLVIADSDIHVQPDYLERLVATLEQPGTGLATTLYAGLPAGRSLAARLGATQISHGFLPGALLARAIGREDCLGATMCLRRDTLAQIGGFPALVDHLADDNILGRRVQDLGLSVRLADTVPLTTVPETRLRALFRHELRWARTISALAPVPFAASVLQYPLAWALVGLVASGGALWSLGVFFVAWLVRAAAAAGIDNALRRRLGEPDFSAPVGLLPFRDLFSVAVMLVSYAGKQVDWRGYRLQADGAPPHEPAMLSLRPAEDLFPR